MNIDSELNELEEHVGDSPEQWQEIFEKLNIDSKIVGSDVRMKCPQCDSKRGISLKLNKDRFDYFKWKCWSCDCNKKFYDNIVGLIRAHRPTPLSPRDAINLLIDAAYQPTGPLPKLKLTMGLHAFKSLKDVPYSYLKWLATDLTSPIPQLHRDQITDYLWGNSKVNQ